jgi:hypothetical protein
MMGIGSDPYALSPETRKIDLALMRDALQRMRASASPFAEAPFIPPERHEWN